MKIEINKSETIASTDIDKFNEEAAIVLMNYLKIKREPVITLFSEINKVASGTFRGRRKLLQVVPYAAERKEKNKVIKTIKGRNILRIHPTKFTEGNCQTTLIEYIRRDGYIIIQSINSVERQLKLKLTPVPESGSNKPTAKEKRKNAISYRDRMTINALIEHQNIYLKDYAEIIQLLNKKTILNESPSTNLRKIKSLEEIKKNKIRKCTSNKTTEIIINTNNKERYYYLISNGEKQYLIQEKEAARKLILNGVSDCLLVINKIQMAFTEATGYLNDEYNLSFDGNITKYRDGVIKAIKEDNTFLRKNKNKWTRACNIKVLWKNYNSKDADVIALSRTVITSRIHESQNHKDMYDEENHIGNSNVQASNTTQNNSILKQKIDNILHNLRKPNKSE